jgi:hypothetical protein
MSKPGFSEKNIITYFDPPYKIPREGEQVLDFTSLLWLDERVTGGSMYSECHWVWGLNDKAKPGPDVKTHVHDFDEVLCFIGSNKEDPTDLGAEIEIWIDGKKYIITKTCMIYVPRGTKHLPLRFLKINRPFIFATHGNGQYNVTEYDGEPR